MESSRLNNKNITSDVLKGLHFPEGTKSIDLSRNQITTLKGVRFPEGLEHLNLSHNQIITLEGVRLPSTIITLDLSYNPELTLHGVNDFLQLGWREYRPYRGPNHPMNKLFLTRTKVTLKGDLCYMENIPGDFSIHLNEGIYTNSRGVNEIEEACREVISKSEPGSFGARVMQLKGGKKRRQAKRQQTKRRQTRRQQTKRRQAKRQSKLKK